LTAADDGERARAARLLNENQRRRVLTHLRLLREDLENVMRLPALAPDTPAGRRIGEVVGRIEAEIRALRVTFGLREDEPPLLRRHVAAIAEVWWSRVEDLRARRLKAYGEVHPELSAVLDPHVERLEDLLLDLAKEAAHLPETME
jgi:hypothetical protein